MTDPFDALASPPEPKRPRAQFAADLRMRVANALGLDPAEALPTVSLPERKQAMSTSTATSVPTATSVIPYITVSDGAAALEWYATAFGAVEQFRVVGDDGRLGHAEFVIGDAHFMLSDEYPELGVRSPATLGGSSFALYLSVTNVDELYARAVGAGATALRAPVDEPHGNRQGTLADPYGHRWMLAQPLEAFDLETYRQRSAGSGYEVVGTQPGHTVTSADRPGTGGGIWAAVFYEDALAGIRFLVDVLGFEEQLVVVGDDNRTVVHSELRWPEGGVVQAGTYSPGHVYSLEPGKQSLYLVTADPQSVWERVRAAGVTVLTEPYTPDYDPGGMGFGFRDPEGNIWSVGSYGYSAG
jgi:PhnB protein